MGVTTRIYQLHHLFKQGKRLSKQQMLDRLEISHSTLKRDIDVLRDQLLAPLVCDRSDNRYYYDLSHGKFELPGLWFNESELYALLASQQLLESVQPGLMQSQIAPLKDRISSLLETSGHSSDTLASCITLTPGTTALDVTDDREALIVHAMYAADAEAIRKQISGDLEYRLLRVMRGDQGQGGA